MHYKNPSLPSVSPFGIYINIARFVPDSLVFIPVLELVEIDKHLTGMRRKAGPTHQLQQFFLQVGVL